TEPIHPSCTNKSELARHLVHRTPLRTFSTYFVRVPCDTLAQSWRRAVSDLVKVSVTASHRNVCAKMNCKGPWLLTKQRVTNDSAISSKNEGYSSVNLHNV
ncbi:unnamed protein product, partial [Scytosiphon promiscuus]